MNYLLDTNVMSELRKGERADTHLREWFAGLADDEVYTSVIVIGEIRKGIESLRRRDPSVATRLESWLQKIVLDHGDRILPIDLETAETWGRFNAAGPLPTVDSLIAATAHVHGLTVATRNTKDIARTGVPCMDPFNGD